MTTIGGIVPANAPRLSPLPSLSPAAPVSKEKTLCDWSKKDLRERFDELSDLVAKPRYACLKCGRAAAKKIVLCKPKALSEKPGDA